MLLWLPQYMVVKEHIYDKQKLVKKLCNKYIRKMFFLLVFLRFPGSSFKVP